MSTQSELEIIVTAKDEASKSLGGISANLKTLGKNFLVVGGVIDTAMGFAVKSAMEAQTQMAQFDAIVSKLPATFTDVEMTMADVRQEMVQMGNNAIKLGFDDEAVTLATARLAQSTGDLGIALQGSGLAMDLARAKGIDLETATSAINMALQGSPKLLKQYGIELDDTATKSEILSAVQAKVGGTAQAMTNTFLVQSQVLSVQFGNLQEQIGNVLLPILSNLLSNHILPIIQSVIAWTTAHPELTKWIVIVTAVLGLLLTAIGSLLLILPAVMAGFTALGVVLLFLSANPIVIIIAGVVALTTALLILDDGLLSSMATWTTFWNTMKDGAREAVDFVIGKINSLISAFNRIPVMPNISSIPFMSGSVQKRAGGGDVMAGSPYLVGEQGAELFVPRQSGSIIPNGAMGGGITVNINGGTYLSERVALDIGNMIVNKLKNVSRITR